MPTDDESLPTEAGFARRLAESLKWIEAIVSVVSYVLIAVLGLLYYLDVLEELWVVALPAVQQLTLKFTIGAYYGAKVAPRVIDEQNQ